MLQLEIGFLPPAAAADRRFVDRLVRLINDAYRTAEDGMWLGGINRTSEEETATAITHGEVVVAKIDDQMVGSVFVGRLDERTGWFGALAVHLRHLGSGVGSNLVAFAEGHALSTGADVMQIEILEPGAGHSHTDRLADWYQRSGYVFVRRLDLADFDPTAVPFLTGPCGVAILRKTLSPLS